MTHLLVSVRDASEASLAVSAGAHLIDVKEPSRGSLGPVDPGVLADVVRQVGSRRPVSVAMGEVREPANRIWLASVPAGIRYAKLGLAGCAQETSWRRHWKRRLEMLPDGVDSVAVIYADWESAGAPHPLDIVAGASEVGCRAVLVDTHDKRQGHLTQLMTLDTLFQLSDNVRGNGLKFVLAGSLNARLIRQLTPIRPDYFAVRGAACQNGDRCGQIDVTRIRSLLKIIEPVNGSA